MLEALLLTVRITVPVPQAESEAQPCTEGKACFDVVTGACQAAQQPPPNRVEWDEGRRCIGWCGEFEDTRIKVACDALGSIDPRRFRRGSKKRERVEEYLARLEAKEKKRKEREVDDKKRRPVNAKTP